MAEHRYVPKTAIMWVFLGSEDKQNARDEWCSTYLARVGAKGETKAAANEMKPKCAFPSH